ncbi:MAG: hypothetical protein HOP04_01640 [Methylophilaceae bacterium]|nr:hypothetical protein [Methylophilaceae bacterium]
MAHSKNNIEPGYKAVLVREETKLKLQGFRKTVPDRDLMQERRLATAALEYCLNRPEVMLEVLKLVNEVVMLDIQR